MLMNLAFVPLYIHYLGIEAYGLIGLFAALQAWLSLIDMGMTPALSREMARFTAGGHTSQSIRDLLRSVEIIALGLAAIIAIGIGVASDWLSREWLAAEEFSTKMVAQALLIMGVVSALRFLENIYRSTIIGLQKQVLLNKINVTMVTLRGFGAAACLEWYSSTITVFFLWQGLMSVLTLLLMYSITYKSIPKAENPASFSWGEIGKIKKFTSGMMFILFLSVLYSQVDKLILPLIVSLTEYGSYMLAFTVASVLYQIITPITQAYYPKFCELVAKGDELALRRSFHAACQLVSVVGGTITIVLALNSYLIVQTWTGNESIAGSTYFILSLLTVANFLSVLNWIPYQIQIAHGWTSLSIKLNSVTVLVLLPMIFYFGAVYGVLGVGWSLIVINTLYFVFGIRLMFRKILRGEVKKWYVNDTLTPFLISFLFGLLCKFLFELIDRSGLMAVVLYLAFATSLVLFVGTMLSTCLREEIIKYAHRYKGVVVRD